MLDSSQIADIQRMEQEIETRLASDNLTDRETQQLKKELDRTATRYSKYVLDMVGEYKPKLTATKLNNKDMHDLRDLSYLGVGMGSVAEVRRSERRAGNGRIAVVNEAP